MSDRAREPAAVYGEQSAVAEQRVVLHNVSWQTFERLLEERGESPVPRFAFDEGNLEIMSPQMPHETAAWLIGQMICVLTDVFGLDRKGVGSMTCKREDKQRGLEPDTSFYIKNEALMRGVTELDLAIHPPPDLMVEVDISRSSMNKLNIYMALGVPEVWRYDGCALRIFVLRKSKYAEASESPTFPGLPLGTEIPRFVAKSATVDEGGLLAEFRTWVKGIRK